MLATQGWVTFFLMPRTEATPQTSWLHSYCHLLKNERNLPEVQQGLAGHRCPGHPVNNNKKGVSVSWAEGSAIPACVSWAAGSAISATAHLHAKCGNTVLGCPRLSMNKVSAAGKASWDICMSGQTEDCRGLALVGNEARATSQPPCHF